MATNNIQSPSSVFSVVEELQLRSSELFYILGKDENLSQMLLDMLNDPNINHTLA